MNSSDDGRTDLSLSTYGDHLDWKTQVLEKLFLGLPESVIIQDDGDPPLIRDLNQAAERIFGYGREELLGRSGVILHADLETVEELRREGLLKVAEDGFFKQTEYTMKRKDGTLFPAEFTIYELKDDRGGRLGWVSIIRDESEKRRAEEELRRSEEWFRAVFDSQAAGIVILNVGSRRVARVNQCYADLLGYTPEEMVGLRMEDLNVPSEHGEAKSQLERLVSGEQKEYVARRWVRKKDGDRILVEVRGSLIRDSRGNPAYTMSVINDLSDRNRAEEEKDLRLKLRGVLEMAGAACHELNQPLQALTGQLDLLALKYPQGEFAGRLEKIMDHLDRLGRTTLKIQGITRYETKDYAGETTIVDIDRSAS